MRIGIVMVMNDDRRLLCVLSLLLTGSALLGLFLHFLLEACEFAVNHDTTAIFAYDNLLVHLDIYLALWWNLVVATATGITLLYGDTKTVTGTLADALETCQQTGLNHVFLFFGITAGGCDIFDGRKCGMGGDILIARRPGGDQPDGFGRET